MKLIATTLSLFVITAVATTAFATLPTPGMYTPADGVYAGRASQSWAEASNAAMGLGDVFNAQSVNEVLGSQWSFACGVQEEVQAYEDFRDDTMTGKLRITDIFMGGTFHLSKDGPWGNGEYDYHGTLQMVMRSDEIQYLNGVPVASVGTASAVGTFDEGRCALTFAIINSVGVGNTDLLAEAPEGYPALIGPQCEADRRYGQWGDIISLQLQIDCPVQTEVSSSWGDIKSIYR